MRLQTQALIDTIRDRVPLEDVVSEYGVKLESRGSRHIGLCPFHEEKTPSFGVNTVQQFYKCFGCNTGGDVITFVMKVNGYSFREALQELAERAGVTLTEGVERQRQSVDLLSAAVDFYHAELLKSGEYGSWATEQRRYLEGRGVNAQTMRDWRIGLAPRGSDPLIAALRTHGYDERALEQHGLLYPDNGRGRGPRFKTRIMIPLFDHRKRVIGFAGRTVDAKEQVKYLNSNESSLYHKREHLFGLHRAIDAMKKRTTAVLTEGYLDVVVAHTFGMKTAVCPGGTALTAQQATLLKRYTDSVEIVMDGDDAGYRAAEKNALMAWMHCLEPKIVELPVKNDLDNLLLREGTAGYDALPRYTLAEFMVRRRTMAGIRDDTHRRAIALEICGAARREKAPEKLKLLLHRVANELDIPVDTVARMIWENARIENASTHVAEAFVAGLLRHPGEALSHSALIPPDSSVFSPELRAIYSYLLDNECERVPQYGAKQRNLFGDRFNAAIQYFTAVAEEGGGEFPTALLTMLKFGTKLNPRTLRYDPRTPALPLESLAESLLLEERRYDEHAALRMLHDARLRGDRNAEEEAVARLSSTMPMK